MTVLHNYSKIFYLIKLHMELHKGRPVSCYYRPVVNKSDLQYVAKRKQPYNCNCVHHL